MVIYFWHYSYSTSKFIFILITFCLRSSKSLIYISFLISLYFVRHSDHSDLNTSSLNKRIHRILTYDLPQYFALISRFRQEVAFIGSDGGIISSTVAPQVQAVFPPGSLQKRIKVGLQVCNLPSLIHCIWISVNIT